MLGQLVRCFMGILLALSAWSKFRDPAAFLEVVRGYPLPKWADARVWWSAVGPLEGLLGVALLFGRPGWLTQGALAGALAFVGFATVAVAVRRARGETRFRCGCGGDLSEVQGASWILARNGVLMAVLAAGLAEAPAGHQRAATSPPLVLAGVGLVLGLRLFEAALRAWGITREWKALGSSRTSPSGA